MSVQPPAPPPGAPPPPPAAQPPPPPLAAQPPPYVDPDLLRPRRVWYWVSGSVALASVAVAIALLVGFAGSLFETLTGSLTPLRTPGAVTIELEPGAERTIYRQVRDESGPIIAPRGSQVDCSVTRVGGGAIELGDAFALTLTRNSDRYEALFDFEATEAGNYRVACRDPVGPQARVPLAIGETIGLLRFLAKLAAVLGAFFGGLAIAAAIAIVTVIRRDSHKRRLQHEAMQR